MGADLIQRLRSHRGHVSKPPFPCENKDFPVTEAAMLRGRGARALLAQHGKQIHVACTQALSKFTAAMPEGVAEFKKLITASWVAHTGIMNWCGTEYMALPNLRFGIEGERLVVAIPWKTVFACAGKVSPKACGDTGSLADVLRAFSSTMTDFEGVTDGGKLPGAVFARIGANTSIYTPCGWVLHERAINGSMGFGIRAPVMVPACGQDDNVAAMLDFLTKTRNEGAALMKLYVDKASGIRQ